MKRKYSSKPQGKSPTCPYAGILRRMPPLRHSQDGQRFKIWCSDVCRFILLGMGLDPWSWSSWSKAAILFREAGFERVLVFDHGTRLWQGCDYREAREKDKKSLQIARIMDQIHKARLARKSRAGRPQERG